MRVRIRVRHTVRATMPNPDSHPSSNLNPTPNKAAEAFGVVSSRTFGSTKAALGFATKLKRRANVCRANPNPIPDPNPDP